MTTYARLMLHTGEVLRIDGDESLELVCENGEFWLTGNGGEDHHLRPGEHAACQQGRLVLEGNGTLLLRPAIRQSRYRIPAWHPHALSRLSLKTAPSRNLKGA